MEEEWGWIPREFLRSGGAERDRWDMSLDFRVGRLIYIVGCLVGMIWTLRLKSNGREKHRLEEPKKKPKIF